MDLKGLFKRTLNRFFARPSVYFSGYSYPSAGLTPQRLAEIFREADNGNVVRQAELFAEMEEKDAHLSSVLQTRKLSVCGLDFDILPLDDSKQQKDIASFLKQKLMAIENFRDAIFDLMDAVSKGFSVLEIMYEYSDGEIWVTKLEFIDQRRFSFATKEGIVSDKPRLLTENNMVFGEDLADNKFIYFRHKARSGLTVRSGLLRVCSWMYLFKNYALKDWVIFSERYAMPMRVGKFMPGAGEDDINTLKQAVLQLGSDGAAVISDNTLIELIESKARGDVGAYEKLCSYCDKQMSKAVLGQTLTTEEGSSGSYALGKVQHLVRQDILKADVAAVSQVLRNQLLGPLTRFHFGDVNIPQIKFFVPEEQDLSKESEIIARLAKDVGLPISKKWMYERFNIMPPAEKEDTLSFNVALKAKTETKTANFTPQQQVIENFVDELVGNAGQSVEKILNTILKTVKQSKDFEDLQEKIIDNFADYKSDDLENLLTLAIFIADLYGRFTVKDD